MLVTRSDKKIKFEKKKISNDSYQKSMRPKVLVRSPKFHASKITKNQFPNSCPRLQKPSNFSHVQVPVVKILRVPDENLRVPRSLPSKFYAYPIAKISRVQDLKEPVYKSCTRPQKPSNFV